MVGPDGAVAGVRWLCCPDCTAPLCLPYDWRYPPTHQPAAVRGWARAALIDHAWEKPILHPRVLPDHHATGRRVR